MHESYHEPAGDLIPDEALEGGKQRKWLNQDVALTHGQEAATWTLEKQMPDGSYELKHENGGVIYRTRAQLSNDPDLRKTTAHGPKGWKYLKETK